MKAHSSKKMYYFWLIFSLVGLALFAGSLFFHQIFLLQSGLSQAWSQGHKQAQATKEVFEEQKTFLQKEVQTLTQPIQEKWNKTLEEKDNE